MENYTKEDYLRDLEFLNEKRRKLDEQKEAWKNQYIESNKPCSLDDNVQIELRDGRKVKGSVKSFGILQNQSVCITSYVDAKDNKTKYITATHGKVTIL